MNRRELLFGLGMVMGAAISASVSRAVLAGVTVPGENSAGRMGDTRLALISRLTDLIIPATDTPGALAAGVPAFVDLIYNDWYREQERKEFDDGMSALAQYVAAIYSCTFLECDADTQISMLVAADVGQAAPPIARFVHTIKELTTVGYYTSEIGARHEMIYQPVPIHYKGDYLYADAGRQWSR